jgi:hypothetical protein
LREGSRSGQGRPGAGSAAASVSMGRLPATISAPGVCAD